jgi:hypothetical protein
MNKIVARFADGRIVKGFTSDFSPQKRMFHLTDRNDSSVEMIDVEKLKAVFIVKKFEGDPGYRESGDFQGSSGPAYGSRIRIVFRDGEEMVGVGMGYSPDKVGFFLTPSDPESNIIRAFVINDFVDHVEKL